MRHFLKETDFTYAEAGAVFEKARKLKQFRGTLGKDTLAGQTWALIFAKSTKNPTNTFFSS